MDEKRRRFFMTISGVLISGFSVGILNLSLFGMDPFQVLTHGIWMNTNIGFGTFYTVVNLLMLIALFIIDKSKIGLGTLINIFLLGYVVQFSSWMFNILIPKPILIIRIISLIIGIVVICFGSAMYFIGDMGVSTYDAVSLILSEKKSAKFQYCRMGTDLICTIIGFLLGATVGIGTVITALFMGPIIVFFSEKVAIPFRYGKN